MGGEKEREEKWDSEGFLKDIDELTNRTKQKKGNKTMSFIQLGNQLAEAKEETPVAEGEYKVRITYADHNEGRNWIIIRAEIAEDPYAKEVSIFLNLPGSGRTPKEENRNLLSLQEFFKCFGFDPTSSYNVEQAYPEGFVGAEGWVILGPPVDDGKGYGPQNRVKRFLASR